jgi:hypothetical protein
MTDDVTYFILLNSHNEILHAYMFVSPSSHSINRLSTSKGTSSFHPSSSENSRSPSPPEYSTGSDVPTTPPPSTASSSKTLIPLDSSDTNSSAAFSPGLVFGYTVLDSQRQVQKEFKIKINQI